MMGQTDGRTDGRTPYRFIDPVPYTMGAVLTRSYYAYRREVQGPDLQNILRFIVRLSELIVRSTYDGDLQSAEIFLRNIV